MNKLRQEGPVGGEGAYRNVPSPQSNARQPLRESYLLHDSYTRPRHSQLNPLP